MRLQHLAIIFVIIILPISLVLSSYTNTHIKTINYQTTYNTSLINSTYDSIKAFQLNTANNMYSTISNSKIRDIESAINVFYTSLGINLGTSGYGKEELKLYTPAILFTLYDGYYIYSNYYDTILNDYTYGLKPFISYSCRYVRGSNYDFVVNYTLDNTITIIGKVNGTYVTKTGHLINLNSFENIQTEILTENLIILNSTENSKPKAELFQYIVYNNQKIYRDNNMDYFNNDDDNSKKHRYFYYSTESRKDYLNNLDIINYLDSLLDSDKNLHSNSAQKYYSEAKSFTEWVKTNLKNITVGNAVNVDGSPITDFATTNMQNERIFNTSDTNDPLQSNSIFNEHRMNVIRKSIETNLVKSIASFSEHALVGYEFAMPKLGEEEWYQIQNNISIVTFLQGLPIGAKVYNNYCVVSNDSNKEAVSNESIYIIDSNKEYHKPGCEKLIEDLNNGNITIKGAYPSSEFKRKTVSLTGEDANAHTQLSGLDDYKYAYYYPEDDTACYRCIVNASATYSTDDIIADNVRDSNGNKINITNLNGQNLRNWYITALARARYDLYLTNGYFGY